MEKFRPKGDEGISTEIPTVSGELYERTREALAEEGYTFVVDIKPLSIGQLFVFVSFPKYIRNIVSPQMEVAINPNNLRIEGSNSESTDAQIEMIAKEEARLKGKLPQEARGVISMCMQRAPVLVQLERAYKEDTGKVLFTDWSGRTDTQTVPGYVATVGRNYPSYRFDVADCSRDTGNKFIFAVPAVVLPRKLS